MNRQRSLGPTLTPRELFPWLSAGVSLQMINNSSNCYYHYYDDEEENMTTDPVFLIVSDKVKRRYREFHNR